MGESHQQQWRHLLKASLCRWLFQVQTFSDIHRGKVKPAFFSKTAWPKKVERHLTPASKFHWRVASAKFNNSSLGTQTISTHNSRKVWAKSLKLNSYILHYSRIKRSNFLHIIQQISCNILKSCMKCHLDWAQGGTKQMPELQEKRIEMTGFYGKSLFCRTKNNSKGIPAAPHQPRNNLQQKALDYSNKILTFSQWHPFFSLFFSVDILLYLRNWCFRGRIFVSWKSTSQLRSHHLEQNENKS